MSRLLDLLVQQTHFGNVQWSSVSDDLFRYSGSQSHVFIESRDKDKIPPFILTLTKLDGEITDTWTAWGDDSGNDDLSPQLAVKVRRLYEEVQRQQADDPMLSLIRDLEDLPPF